MPHANPCAPRLFLFCAWCRSSAQFEGHALIPQKLKSSIDLACSDFSDPSPQCKKLLDQSSALPGDFNVYNMYDVCNGDDAARVAGGARAEAALAAKRSSASQGRKGRLQRVRAALRSGNSHLVLGGPADSLSPHPALAQAEGGALNDFVCGGENVMQQWLAAPSVLEALHVDATTGGMRYNANVGDITELYDKLINTAKYYVLIYSGDVDACVPYWGTERFTERIGGGETEAWHAWKSNTVEDKGEIVAGYAVSYKNFQFITIKGAGHMVPTFKPRVALTMFDKFLKGETF